MRKIALVSLVLPLALTLAACSGGTEESSSGTKSITVATAPIADYAPLYVGVEQGFFKEQGLDVKFGSGRVGTETITAVLSGSTDFAGVALPPLLVAQSQNLDVAVISPSSVAPSEDHESAARLLANAGTISSPKDLEGKTVAVNALKAQAELMVRWYLEGQGVDASKIRFIEVPFAEMPAALKRGDVDAITAVEPFLSTALADGATDIGQIDRALPTGSPMTAFFTSDRLAETDPETVQKFAAAISKSLDYAADHPDEVRKAVVEYAKVPAETVEKIALPTYQSSLDRDGIAKVRDEMTKFGFLTSEFDLNTIFWNKS